MEGLQKDYGKPGSSAHYFEPQSVVQSLLTWPNRTARESGKCDLSAYPRQK